MTVWPMQSLADLGEIVTGGTPKTADPAFFGGPVPFVTPSDLDLDEPITLTSRTLSNAGATQVRPVPKNAVMVCCIGSLGKVGIAGTRLATNQQINSVVFDPERVYPRFGLYACKRLKPDLEKHGSSTTVAIVNKSSFGRLEIPVPPLLEQRRIAAILDEADALRAKRRAALAQLDEMARAIFLDMFGDPSTNAKSWPIVPISDLISSAAYGTSEKASETGAIPVLRMNNITYGGAVSVTDLKYMDLPQSEFDRFTVRKGDLLFNRTNSPDLVGKTAVFDRDVPMAFAGYLVRLRANSGASPEYIAAFLNSAHGKAVLRGMCKTIIGMANINAKEVQRIKIPKPPRSLQDQFSERLASVGALRETYRADAIALDALFASLQHRAFQGEL